MSDQNINFRRYERDVMYELKLVAEKLNLNVVDTSVFTEELANKAFRNRNRSGAIRGDDGPQKRTWNTGCHVVSSDSSGGHHFRSKYDFKNSDKNGTKSNGDYKRNFDKGSWRRENKMLPRGDQRNDRRDERLSRSQNEAPEWFSAGPTTVHETIELTGAPDFDLEERKETKNIDQDDVSLLNDSAIKSVQKSNSSTNTQDILNEKPSTIKSPPENKNIPRDTASLNARLQQLLRGDSTKNETKPQPVGRSVRDIENKLRSLLIGPFENSKDETLKNECEKSEIHFNIYSLESDVLTVTELEEQLCAVSTKNNEHSIDKSLFNKDKASRPAALQPGTNILPVLQSLVNRQNRSGFIDSSNQYSTRIPQTTNAMAASAQLNQLKNDFPGKSWPSNHYNNEPYAFDNLVSHNIWKDEPHDQRYSKVMDHMSVEDSLKNSKSNANGFYMNADYSQRNCVSNTHDPYWNRFPLNSVNTLPSMDPAMLNNVNNLPSRDDRSFAYINQNEFRHYDYHPSSRSGGYPTNLRSGNFS